MTLYKIVLGKVFRFVPRQEKMSDKLHLVEKACISIINNID